MNYSSKPIRPTLADLRSIVDHMNFHPLCGAILAACDAGDITEAANRVNAAMASPKLRSVIIRRDLAIWIAAYNAERRRRVAA